jgi:hypothetical protein
LLFLRKVVLEMNRETGTLPVETYSCTNQQII